MAEAKVMGARARDEAASLTPHGASARWLALGLLAGCLAASVGGSHRWRRRARAATPRRVLRTVALVTPFGPWALFVWLRFSPRLEATQFFAWSGALGLLVAVGLTWGHWRNVAIWLRRPFESRWSSRAVLGVIGLCLLAAVVLLVSPDQGTSSQRAQQLGFGAGLLLVAHGLLMMPMLARSLWP